MSKPLAYYNEIETAACDWMQNLMDAGHIAAGKIDNRSINDVRPDDLQGFTQCHFFAGIGGWSLALRKANWADDRPVFTGSCPCQPFSPAGKGLGKADPRHLWPVFRDLIVQCRPPVVFGEQVGRKNGKGWFDDVHANLEDSEYASGMVSFPACSVGAPHKRDRLYWFAEDFRLSTMADDSEARLEERIGTTGNQPNEVERPERLHAASQLDHAESLGCQHGEAVARSSGPTPRRGELIQAVGRGRELGRLVHSDHANEQRIGGTGREATESGALGWDRVQRTGDASSVAEGGGEGLEGHARHVGDGRQPGRQYADEAGPASEGREFDSQQPGPTNGFWGSADWLGCRDGKFRPVEPGTFPLAHGLPWRVGRVRSKLRSLGHRAKDIASLFRESKPVVAGHSSCRKINIKGYGNAIVIPAAVAFIESYLESKQ